MLLSSWRDAQLETLLWLLRTHVSLPPHWDSHRVNAWRTHVSGRRRQTCSSKWQSLCCKRNISMHSGMIDLVDVLNDRVCSQNCRNTSATTVSTPWRALSWRYLKSVRISTGVWTYRIIAFVTNSRCGYHQHPGPEEAEHIRIAAGSLSAVAFATTRGPT